MPLAPLSDLPLDLRALFEAPPSELFGAPVALIAFGALAAFIALYSLLLLYHWLRYGRSSPLTWGAMAVYFGVQALLLGTMSAAALNLA